MFIQFSAGVSPFTYDVMMSGPIRKGNLNCMMTRLTENVLDLGNPYFHYYIIGKKHAVLVECGVTAGVQSMLAEWELLSDKPEIIKMLAMHAHFDHVCGIPALKERFPHAQVAASQEAVPVLRNPSIMESFFAQDDAMSDVMVKRRVLDNKPVSAPVKEITVDCILGEGSTLMVDNSIKLEIIAAPGHSPCGLAAYLPGEQVMFLSDAAGFQINEKEIFPIFFQSYSLYIDTIKRLAAFPARVLAVPHGRIISVSEVPVFYQRSLQAAEFAYNWIRELLDSGTELSKLRQILFQHYYRDDLQIYTPDNIYTCVDLLIKRTKQASHG